MKSFEESFPAGRWWIANNSWNKCGPTWPHSGSWKLRNSKSSKQNKWRTLRCESASAFAMTLWEFQTKPFARSASDAGLPNGFARTQGTGISLAGKRPRKRSAARGSPFSGTQLCKLLAVLNRIKLKSFAAPTTGAPSWTRQPASTSTAIVAWPPETSTTTASMISMSLNPPGFPTAFTATAVTVPLRT